MMYGIQHEDDLHTVDFLLQEADESQWPQLAAMVMAETQLVAHVAVTEMPACGLSSCAQCSEGTCVSKCGITYKLGDVGVA